MSAPTLPAKSAKLIAAERRLQEVEAAIAAERKRREAELQAAYEQARRDAEAIKQVKNRHKTGSTPATPAPATPLAAPLAMPTPAPLPPELAAHGPGTRDLPEPALLLLRDLWAVLGYTGEAFVEMQMEISRELEHADFARFEREMVCNDLLVARTEIHMLREERGQLLRRLELNRENINQLMETEERTYKTLLAERTASEKVVRRLEADVREARAERDGAQARAAALAGDLERSEKARIAAVLFAKGAEERAASAAAAATEATRRNASVPPTPPANSIVNTLAAFWSTADDEALKAKLKERTLAVEEEKLLAEGKKLKAELAKVKDEREKLKTMATPKSPDIAYHESTTKDTRRHSEMECQVHGRGNNKRAESRQPSTSRNGTREEQQRSKSVSQGGGAGRKEDEYRSRKDRIMDLF